jgi:hypothetical protein
MKTQVGRIPSRLLLFAVVASCLFAFPARAADADPTRIILVVGASGADEYGALFSEWSDDWVSLADKAEANLVTIGKSDPGKLVDREQLKSSIEQVPADGTAPLWIVMIGHGTYARGVAKFNMRGPDVSADELAQWLGPLKRPVVIVNCASSSAPFINKLSANNRIVVTATRSGAQQNFARFGEYFSQAIASPESDLDHDDEVSVHEAFLRASNEVRQFYDAEARISTEQALIDDNGDGRGTPAKMFRGVRPVAKAKEGAALDGPRAMRITLSPSGKQLTFTDQERKARAAIEQQLEQIRAGKSELTETEYDAAIEPLMLQLARIYQAAEQRQASSATSE